jgi:two-component system osmolarity sensor histidine kinase EnvZ
VLDENTLTSEIREVNMGFNRMARELAKVEEDRAVMLAGISHDLRTPLARLRLEAEMSVADPRSPAQHGLDIDQLDAIIDKFMDYARPGEAKLVPVNLAQLVDKEAAPSATRARSASCRALAIDIRCWPTRSSWAACSATCSRTRAATAAASTPASPWCMSPTPGRARG